MKLFALALLVGVAAATTLTSDNWQMLYGTVLYFSQYCLNERYKGWGKTEVGIVIVANGIWIAFPAHIMLCCWRLIESGTFDAFRAGGYPL